MRRSGRGALVALVVVALVAGALSALALTRTGPFHAGRSAAPRATATAHPTPSPPAASPVLAALPSGAPTPSATGLETTLAPLLAARRLGHDVGAVVLDGRTGRVLLDRSGSSPQTPASTAKLLTTAAALQVLGPDATLRTRVVLGPAAGQIVLVGGGDPTLTALTPAELARSGWAGPTPPASLRDLATRTAAALRARGVTAVRVAVDDSLFGAPAVSPDWEKQYVPSGVVAPVSALTTDEARKEPGRKARYLDPALAAGGQLASMLAADGLTVSGTVTRAAAPVTPTELASVESPPVSELVERALTLSDNDLAEALLRQVAVHSGRPATFAGGASAVLAAVGGLGVPTEGVRLLDGSGLARDDLVPARTLAGVLAAAADPANPQLDAVLTGLPVAGFSGTLAGRFDGGSAAGVVRAKTGTLTGVSTLAGTTVDADGALLVFAVMADEIPPTGTLGARKALDQVAAALAGCGCR